MQQCCEWVFFFFADTYYWPQGGQITGGLTLKTCYRDTFLTGVGAVGKVRVITEEDSYQLTKKQLHVSGSIKALVDF